MLDEPMSWAMYLRHTTRRKAGKVHRYWQLVRSGRVGRKVIQQIVAHLGELDAHGRARAQALARAPVFERAASRQACRPGKGGQGGEPALPRAA